MKSRWVEHNGKRVFIADYSEFGIDSNLLQKEADEALVTLSQEPRNSVRAISNVAGTKASRANVQILMNIIKNSNLYVTKRCVIGVSGVRWTFLDAFNQLAGRARFQTFNSLEEALDWIVQD